MPFAVGRQRSHEPSSLDSPDQLSGVAARTSKVSKLPNKSKNASPTQRNTLENHVFGILGIVIFSYSLVSSSVIVRFPSAQSVPDLYRVSRAR